eukprot:3186089-Amphidinium_carterae.3
MVLRSLTQRTLAEREYSSRSVCTTSIHLHVQPQHRLTTLHRSLEHKSPHVTLPTLLLWRRATVPSPDPLCKLPSSRHRRGRTSAPPLSTIYLPPMLLTS